MSKEQKPVPATTDAFNQVSGPSVALLVFGIISALFSLTCLVLNIIGTSVSPFIADRVSEKYTDFYEGIAGIALCFVGLLVDAFIIYASLKMKELTQWTLCIAASILIMIPCSPCCIVGLPIGIWCLVVLMRPEVKTAFH